MAEYEQENIRDHVTLRDEKGNEKEYRVESLFDMDDKSYAMLTTKDDDETLVMRVEGDELIGIADPDEMNAILDSYYIAVRSLPDEEQSELRTK